MAAPPKRRDSLLRHGSDMARQHGDHTRRKRRRDGAALMLPIVAFAQDQPVADDRPQNP